MPRKNLLFIMTDQQKATSLDLYSSINSVETVALREIADRGTTFDAGYCPYPLCVPSRIAMLSGQYPSNSGYVANQPEMGTRLASLFPHLHGEGYRTMLVGKDHAHGLKGRGDVSDRAEGVFDWYYRGGHGARMTDETNRDQPYIEQFLETSPRLKILWGSESAPWSSDESLSAELSRRACEFLDRWDHEDRPSDRPFAMWLSYPDPHEFYQAPQDVVESIDPSSLTLYPNEDVDLTNRAEYIQFMRWYFNAGGVPEDVRLALIRVYLAMCKNVDIQLTRVTRWLSEHDRWRDTVVVYVSDHGDFTGELGLLQKFNAGYDGCCRVPYLIAAPEGRAGQRSDTPINLVDLPPTLCDLLDVPRWVGQQGETLVPILCDNDDGSRLTYTVVESGVPGEHLTTQDIANFSDHRWDVSPQGRWCYDPPHRFGGRMYAVRSRQYKLITREDDRLELYDMQADPWEMRNLAAEPEMQAIVQQHLSWLVEHQGRIIPMQAGSRIADQDVFYRAGGDVTWQESLAAYQAEKAQVV